MASESVIRFDALAAIKRGIEVEGRLRERASHILFRTQAKEAAASGEQCKSPDADDFAMPDWTGLYPGIDELDFEPMIQRGIGSLYACILRMA